MATKMADKVYSSGLSDEEWSILVPLIPPQNLVDIPVRLT